MLKKIFTRALALCSCAAIAVTAGISASAKTLKTEFPGATIPTPKNYTWHSLGAVKGTEQQSKYFVIHTVAGDNSEDLYISLPETGGFRLQSLHELQKEEGLTKPEESAAGIFETKLKDISYKQEADAVVMSGADGTMLRYIEKSGGFELRVCTAAGKKIVSITNKQISFAYNRKGKVLRSMVELPLADKEAIYGGGERFNGANQVGSTISLTNLDCWSVKEYSYNNVPLFHSNRGYSIWFNMYYVGQADIGDTNKRKYSVTFDGSKLDFHLWQGMPLDNLKKYTSITGTSGLSETWTFGFWTGAQNAAFNETRLGNGFANLQDLIEGYKDNYGFYPDACYAEGQMARTAQVVTYLNARNIKVLGWFSPDLWSDLDTIENHLGNHSVLPEKNASGVITDSGQPFVYDTTFLKTYGLYQFANKGYMDFSNPSSVDLISSCWQKYWDWGVVGTMNDFGEWYPFKGTFHNGLEGDEMHNLISYYYAKSASEAWTKAKGGDYVLFQRSGCAGSQYYSGNFLGDNVSMYTNGEEDNGYNAVVRALISMGASGFNLYGADLGGLGGTPTNDLWNRWVQLSVFSPYMRQHGTVIHMPWEYGMLAKNNFGRMYYLRKNLVPMIESAAISAEKTANPIIQGMMIAYPYQLSLVKADTQYMFCDDLLVCPVTEENTYLKQVMLPKGSTWYELNTYKAYDGGQTITAEAPTSDFPIYVKGGSVKPIQLPESMKLGEKMLDDSKDEYQAMDALLITPPDNDRTTSFYDKQGKSTDYHTYNCTTETYQNARTSGSSFTVSNTAGSARNIVLALGVTASSVTADGKKLSRLSHMPDYLNKEYGYYVDMNGMTTVYLPTGWKSLSIEKGVGRSALKLTSDDNANVQNMLDGNVKTSYTLPQQTGEYTTLALSSEESIDEIAVKWAVGFSNSYDIEYSVDGKNWYMILPDSSAAHTVTNGGGSYDKITFSPVKAKYLRLRTAERGDAGSAAVYSFEVFAETKIGTIPTAEPEENKWSDYDPDEYDEEVTWIDGEDTTIETVTRKKRSVPVTKISVVAVVILIVAIVLAVLLITGLIIFLVKRKKKKEATALNAAAGGPDLTEHKNE